MARSTLARVAGRTRSGELSTRETVWWETPARAATSDITGALSLLTSAWLPHTRYGRGTESSARSPRRARTTERSRCRGVCAPTATRADGQVAAAGAPPLRAADRTACIPGHRRVRSEARRVGKDW